MKHKRPSHALSLFLMLAIFPLIAAPSTGGRTYNTTYATLELDGAVVGFLDSYEGGSPYGEVVNDKVGPDRIQQKRIAGVRYEDLTLSFGVGMADALYAWISETATGKSPRKNGSVIMADSKGQVESRLVFYNAIIKEIHFSEFNATSKDAGRITLKLGCGYTQLAGPGGNIPRDTGINKQKRWTQNLFRLKIDGLESSVSKVNRIEALTLTQKTVKNMTGNPKNDFMEPMVVEVSDLRVTLPDAYSAQFRQWMDESVISGTHKQERQGSIEIISPNGQDVVFTLSLYNLGIFRLSPGKVEKGKESSPLINADMYVEGLDMFFTGDDGADDDTTETSRRSG